MKKTNTIFLAAIAVIMAFALLPAAYAQTAQVRASALRYEPYPVEPGTSFKIWIKVENLANEDASDVILSLEPGYPFRLQPGEENKVSIGILPSREQYVKDFKVIVDAEAVQGDAPFKVRVSPNGGAEWQEASFNVRVQTKDATMGVDTVRTIPEKLEPGKEAIVEIRIKNMADSTLKDISVKLDLFLKESITTSIATDYPFAPLGSTGQKFIKSLRSGETASFVFNIITLPNTNSGVYKVPIIIEYKDSLNNEFTLSDITGFIVGGKPDLSISVDSSSVYSDSPAGVVVLKFTNKGLANIKFLDVKLNETDEFGLLSASNNQYIGNLDSDDFDTAEFVISTKKHGEITLPITVEYKDASNNDYLEKYNLHLKVISKKEAGVNGNNTGTVILFLILIVIVIFFVARAVRKKKKKRINN